MEHPAIITRLDGDSVTARDLEFQNSGEAITVWAQASFDVEFEGLLAERLDNSLARLLAVPVLTAGLRLDDVVNLWIDEETGAEVIESVSEKSSFATYLVRLKPEQPGNLDSLFSLMDAVQPVECWFDVINDKLIGVAVPASAVGSISAVFAALTDDDVIFDWMRWDAPDDGTVSIYTG